MTRHFHLIVPGDPETLTGGYGYDRRLVQELARLGWQATMTSLDGSFPHPDAGALENAARIVEALADDSVVMIDGLACGAMPELVRRAAARLRLIALVHHPLADESGLSEPTRASFRQMEAAALEAVHAVICTSRTTASRLIAQFAVPAAKLWVAPPGTDRFARAGMNGDPPIILCVGALVPRKGHDILIQALQSLSTRPWLARFVGPDDRDQAWREHVRNAAVRAGLAERIVFAGAVRDVEAEYARADIFALATRHEGYGMAFAEALAHGLPVIGCAVGAVGEVVREPAASLVPADDHVAFASALGAVLDDRDLRQRMANAAWRQARQLPSWSAMAVKVDACLQAVAG